MFWKILPWLIIGTLYAIAIAVGYIFTAKIYGRKTAIKLTIQYVGFVVLFMAVYLVMSHFLSAPFKDIFWSILYLVVSFFLAAMLIAQIQGKRQIRTHKTLLNLGLDNNSGWMMLLGFLFILWSLSPISDAIRDSQFTMRGLLHVVVGVLASVVGLYKGTSETVFTDRGIFSISGYVKWSNIRSYKWEESKLPFLKLKVVGSWFSFNRVIMNIPASHKNTVQDLLPQRLFKPENV